MIVVFAPNPALERVALVDNYRPGEPQRPMRVSTFAGGAGLRAASVVSLLGGEPLAVGFAGGDLGVLLRECMERQGIAHDLIATRAGTRGEFLLLDREQGVLSEVPDEAAGYTEEEADRLIATLERRLPGAELLIVADGQASGDPTLFARAIAAATAAGVPILADLHRDALPEAVEGRVRLLRVSLKSLQRHTERSLQHDSAIIAEARTMIDRGVENVIVTLGPEGALLVTGACAWRVKAPIVSHFNPTGSGETLSGALAVYWGKSGDLVQAVRYGCAAASVNVTHDEPGYATAGEIAILLPKTTAIPVNTR